MDAKKERDRLGRIVRDLWIEWAMKQPSPKPSWLTQYDELSESDKEADRVIGYGMMVEFNAEMAGERMEQERLKEIAFRLRQELHGFRELFDENDPSSGKVIREYDEFVGGVYLENAYYDPSLVAAADRLRIADSRGSGLGSQFRAQDPDPQFAADCIAVVRAYLRMTEKGK